MGNYIWPVPAGTRITQTYGTRPGGYNPAGGHTGTDFAVNIGTPLRAPGDGVIAFIGTSDSNIGADNPWLITPYGGKYLALDCGGAEPTFILAHLLGWNCVAGQRVKKGDIIAYSGNSGTATSGPHLHMEVLLPFYNLRSSTYGRSNPANVCTSYWGGMAAAPAANQRRSGSSPVNQREAPRLGAKVTRQIAPNSLEMFRGWTRGDTVTIGGESSDIWYEDQHGFASDLLFDPRTVDGLPDLTPKPAADPVSPTQRVTAADGAQGRTAADKNAPAQGERFAADLILSFKGYVTAPVAPYPDTTPVWFVSISGYYFWAGSFVDEGVHDLPDMTPTAAATPPPVVAVVPAYSFTVDIPVINGITVEVVPANATNIELGNFPAKPVSAVDHHWGTPPISIDSVINEFKRTGVFKSAHYVVTDTRIVQMVSLKDRAYHAGPQGNGFVGVEIDPRGYSKNADGSYTEIAKKIQANVRALHAALNTHYGITMSQMLHKNVPGAATLCSPFDLAVLVPVASVPPVVTVPPVVAPPVTQPATPAPVANERELLEGFALFLVDEYLSNKK